MLHYYVVVLLLINWPCVRSEVGQITPIPDQLAVASVNINQELKKSTTVDPRSHYSKLPDKSETLKYDNSKGFRPIVVPDAQYENALRNESHYGADMLAPAITRGVEVLEDDPVYSTEARIFFNLAGPSLTRRSFDTDSQYNEFELLKVNNNTPAVANYHDFYEDPYNVNEEVNVPEYNHKKPKYKTSRDPIYSQDNYPNNKPYFYNDGQDKDRKPPEKMRVKVSQGELNYPAQRERQEQRSKFVQPVVVVEPASYKVDLKFGSQSVSSKLASSTPANLPVASDSTRAESANHYSQGYSNIYHNRGGTSRHYNGADDSKDASEESMDYSDDTERSRKVSKFRRRPYDSEISKRLPKEHREVYDESYEAGESRKKYGNNRSKQRYRHRNKHNWSGDDKYNDEHDSNEDHRKDNRDQQGNNGSNKWNQPDPNGNIMQQNPYEVNQIEKPKLVPVVPVNIVPVGNFDHATALGNSQGFDMSNVMLQNLGHGTTIVSTSAPLISTSQSLVRTKGGNGYDLLNTVPDVIVGQNTIQNPVQTVLISQPKQNGKTQFLQSTVTPIYAVSTTTSSASQGQSTTARPIFAASTTVAPVQHLAINSLQAGLPVNQLLVPQPTLHTLTNIGQAAANNNIQGQALKSSNFYQVVTPKTKGYVQNAQLVPAILHTGVNLNVQNNQNQNGYNPFVLSKSKENAQILRATNEAFESSMRQLQQQIMKNQGAPGTNYQADAIGSTSNTNPNIVNVIPSANFEKAQLPTLGTKNVEILNPNLKQNPIGLTFASPIGVINQYPTAVLTTPIPILSTTNFATVRPVLPSSTVDSIGLNSYVDTLTELGSKISSGNAQALYNPIQFVPNLDLLKSQSILNSKGGQTDILQQGLNLVPSIPGGNFFKNNKDLVTKPKLSSDLEKYAEEMLKESLRTIYNTHKWNNDRKFPRNISLVDSSPAAKLKNELLRYKPGKDNGRDILEGHHTENKYHVVDSRPGSKRPDFSMAKLEELLMNDFKLHPPISNEPIHVYHHHGPRPGAYSRPSDQGSSYSNTEAKRVRHEINDYLTPPRPNSFISKSPFHDKPVKKRPGRYNNHDNLRHPTRTSKTNGPEAAGSNIYEFNAPYDGYSGGHYDKRHGHSEHRKRPHFEHLFSSLSSPFSDSSGERRGKDILDMNNPRTHNLLGLLMKNNKLPAGSTQAYGRDDDDLESIFNDESRQRQQPQHLDLSVFQKKSDVQPNLTATSINRLRARNYKKA